jgi:hypothetical protein
LAKNMGFNSAFNSGFCTKGRGNTEPLLSNL